jgi:potassium efflux system protein
LILLNKGSKGFHGEDKIISVEAHLEILRKLWQTQNEHSQVLTEIKSVVEQRLALEHKWQNQIYTLYVAQQQLAQRNRLMKLMTSLQQEQQLWLVRLTDLTKNLQSLNQNGEITDTNLRKLQLRILEAEENVALIRLKSYLVQLQNRIENFHEFNKTNKTSATLNESVQQASEYLTQLYKTADFITAKIKLLTMKKYELVNELSNRAMTEKDIYSHSEMLLRLIYDYKMQIATINELEQKTTFYQHEFKTQLQHNLSERQKFPSDLNGWASLGQKMLQLPNLLLNALSNSLHQAIYELQRIDKNVLNFVIFSAIVLLGLRCYLPHYLLNVELNVMKNRQRFFAKVIHILLELIRRNLGGVFLFLIILIITLVTHIATSLLFCLLGVYLCYRIFTTIAKLTLLENINNTSGKDVKLYYRIRWVLGLGALLSGLTVAAHGLPVAYEAKALVNRLLMVFIIMIAIQLFKSRTLFCELLESAIHIRRRYFSRVFKLLCVLIPVALFFNAMLGFLGYVELAWTIGKYQILSVLVLAGYLVARGLLIDGMEFISEIFIRHVKQGWLWTEAFLKPVDRILRLCLLTLSILLLLHFYRLDSNALFINSVKQFLHQKWFSIAQNDITPLILLQLLIIILLIKWLAHWSREFSYRWLYAKSKDVGVRNSLAIFTQYASVIISVLLGLNILGIDLRGFTVVAAAFAAGIGFGIRDLIINFFSGILLLIERPFRTGDIITLGTYEGEVIQTGMRSMTIRTWDHMEVIVPNADMFTKPFTNWTHHDNIVRSVITLKIHREDDPHQVHELILNLLKNHSLVAKEPHPEVIMNEMSESLIEMQVRYYVLISPQRTRIGVRSEVLFAIWDCFKTHKIRTPNPQYDLILKNQYTESAFASAVEIS